MPTPPARPRPAHTKETGCQLPPFSYSFIRLVNLSGQCNRCRIANADTIPLLTWDNASSFPFIVLAAAAAAVGPSPASAATAPPFLLLPFPSCFSWCCCPPPPATTAAADGVGTNIQNKHLRCGNRKGLLGRKNQTHNTHSIDSLQRYQYHWGSEGFGCF